MKELQDWEHTLSQLKAILYENEIWTIELCQINVDEDQVPEALVRPPQFSYLSQRHRDKLPELVLLGGSSNKGKKLLGMYGLQI